MSNSSVPAARWDPWRAEKGARRAALGQEGSTKNQADTQAVQRYHQAPPAPGQTGLMLWRPSPLAKVPSTAGGPAHTSARGESPAMRLREENEEQAKGGQKRLLCLLLSL